MSGFQAVALGTMATGGSATLMAMKVGAAGAVAAGLLFGAGVAIGLAIAYKQCK